MILRSMEPEILSTSPSSWRIDFSEESAINADYGVVLDQNLPYQDERLSIEGQNRACCWREGQWRYSPWCSGSKERRKNYYCAHLLHLMLELHQALVFISCLRKLRRLVWQQAPNLQRFTTRNYLIRTERPVRPVPTKEANPLKMSVSVFSFIRKCWIETLALCWLFPQLPPFAPPATHLSPRISWLEE